MGPLPLMRRDQPDGRGGKGREEVHLASHALTRDVVAGEGAGEGEDELAVSVLGQLADGVYEAPFVVGKGTGVDSNPRRRDELQRQAVPTCLRPQLRLGQADLSSPLLVVAHSARRFPERAGEVLQSEGGAHAKRPQAQSDLGVVHEGGLSDGRAPNLYCHPLSWCVFIGYARFVQSSIRTNLRQLRERGHLTCAEVARRIKERHPTVKGCSGGVIAVWESGSPGRSPSDIQLSAWADVLGCQVVVVPSARQACA